MSIESYKYGRYITANQETRWATIEEIQNAGTRICIADESYPGAGLPLLSNGKEAYVDNHDNHSLIFGSTGSKKTRMFCMPMINFFAKAGESFVTTDPKGELYNRTSGLVKAKGYKTIVLNFRDIGRGDTWNPLELPYRLYNTAGQREAATTLLNDFVSAIAEPQLNNTKDIFWPEMACSLAIANLLLLMESAAIEQANIYNFARLCSGDNIPGLQKISRLISPSTLAGMNYRGVLTAPDKTRESIFVSLFAMVRMFNNQRNLCRMLSKSNFDMARFGREKTAVYLIVPDEKTTLHFLATTFIKQVYEVLISEAQKEEKHGFKLPVRVNFVLDEFCNIPKIPDMPTMISAARSRNMRYFLVAQSMHQLRGKYGEDAETIKGNCENWVFLSSKELSLLQEISELCGSVTMADKTKRPLISVSQLQRLDKAKGEALILHGRQYPIITEMADMDMYEAFGCYAVQPMPKAELPPINPFFLELLINDVLARKQPIPFYDEELEAETLAAIPRQIRKTPAYAARGKSPEAEERIRKRLEEFVQHQNDEEEY